MCLQTVLQLEDIIASCESNIDLFEETATECVKENGYNYSVNAYVDKEYFNTREYEEITLPSGIYNALKIEIGKQRAIIGGALCFLQSACQQYRTVK